MRFSLLNLLKLVAVVCVACGMFRYVTWWSIITVLIVAFVVDLCLCIIYKDDEQDALQQLGIAGPFLSALIAGAGFVGVFWIFAIPLYLVTESRTVVGNVLDFGFVTAMAGGFLFPHIRYLGRILMSLLAFFPF